MTLQDLMEEKQLNLNRPLLSVRKTENSLARIPPLPAYKSELNSGPVRNAGSVPFIWEKTPGKPKDESKTQTHSTEQQQPPIAPNLPPGRVSSKNYMHQENSQNNVPYVDKRVTTEHEGPKEDVKENASSDSDDDYDGDESFRDALDILSRTESFFMNCSVSGWSGLEDQEVLKSPESFLTDDQQGCDFMIGRFLPAAKAMVSETPQYASKKPLVVGKGKHKQVKKVVSAERNRFYNQNRTKYLSHYAIYIGREGRSDWNGYENCTNIACGLFPRFCLPNPMPGLRMEGKVQSSAVHGIKAKSTDSHSETTKENSRTPHYRNNKPVDSWSGFTEEKDISCIPEKCSYESPVVEKTLYVDSVQKVKPHSCSCSVETKGHQTNHRGDDLDALRGGGSCIYKNPSTETSLGKATSQSKSSNNSCNGMHMETNHYKKKETKSRSQGSDLDEDLVSKPKVVKCDKIDLESQVSSTKKSSESLIQNSKVDSKSSKNEKIDLESQCHNETCDAKYLQYPPLALPILKAPSDSWLMRTLPIISSRNVSSRFSLSANICAQSQ